VQALPRFAAGRLLIAAPGPLDYSSSMKEAPAATTGFYRWAVVGMLWLVCLLNYADRQAIFSVFKPLEAEMGIDKVKQGVVGSAFMWVYAAALPFAGLVGDRVNRKWLILGGLVFWSLITLLTALSTEYWHLVVFRALEGFGEAFYMPASLSLIGDYHDPRTRSRAMALHQSSVYAGTVLGGTVAGYYADTSGWRTGFYVFGTLGVILAAVLVLFLREPGRKQVEAMTFESMINAAREVFAHPIVRLLIAVFMGANFVAMIFLTWMPTFLTERFGMSLALAGFNATLWLQAASFVGVLLGGWLADRWARRWRGGRMAVQAIGLFLGAPLIFLTGWTLSVPILVAAMAGFGFFKGLYDANIWAALFDFVRPERRASAQGFMNSLGWLGGAPAPIIVGYLAGIIGLGAAVSAASAIYVAVGVVMVVGLWRLAGEEPLPRPLPEAGRGDCRR
jgi:MFS family permease